jgi:hypothetical protein
MRTSPRCHRSPERGLNPFELPFSVASGEFTHNQRVPQGWRREMRKRTVGAGAALVLVAAVAGGGVAIASGDDGEAHVTGQQADAATAAALEATHGGTANAVERDSENGTTWEVEVTKANGKTVDVRLDEDYKVVVIEGDGEDADGR